MVSPAIARASAETISTAGGLLETTDAADPFVHENRDAPGRGSLVTESHASPTDGRRAFRINRTARIFLALVGGILLGTFLAERQPALLANVLAVAGPIGRLWLNGLTMTVVPLVFGLLVTGIASAAESASAGGIARRALLWFAVLLIAAAGVSALLSSALLAVSPPAESAALLTGPTTAAAPAPADGPTDWVGGLIPTNPIKAAADTAMVPLVVFAMLFGFAMARIAAPLRAALVTAFRGIVETMLVIVEWVLWLAPLGVFALALAVGAQLGLGAAGTLLHYVLIVAAACLSAALLAMLAAVVAGRMSPVAFLRAALPAQVVAVSTQSSLASLPAMIAAAPALGSDRDAAGVIFPLAVSIFRAASAAANIAVAVYLAHLHGVPLTSATLAVGVVTAAAVSLAAVGLPAQVSFFATIAPVCVAMGVPITLLPVLLAVESLPDIFRTFGNVTADLAVVRLAGRSGAREDG
ncbi:dicarboxylate/amino acid:cation symporter [Sphingomonas prati]|uniref:Na+/H+-dicarboxylate symporter n=1 Tax=Sphingomonas prati TaxID=1843237 RepID=A0A7W9BTJ8_9SPHN|nr:cation:dicarboxylase symporter family transporter [Sphingomonas prati]MBB5729684.1 Na+/H+-dicarboxylate symporter [Sphingomonas prati]GGE90274.1 amino acid:proton symporter [Sphingomonas prati]